MVWMALILSVSSASATERADGLGSTGLPVIEAAGAHAQDPAHEGHGIVRLLHLDELEAQLGRWPFSVAKKAAAEV